VRYLLDTHILVWALSEPAKLAEAARKAIEDSSNEVYASAASAWEIGIKAGLGKIDFPLDDLADAIADAGLVELPVSVRHGAAVKDLPLHHRDRFDRLLIAQAMKEGLALVTRDHQLTVYPIQTVPG
jgi:PIN domain nuclease of toxin-antitoxin system